MQITTMEIVPIAKRGSLDSGELYEIMRRVERRYAAQGVKVFGVSAWDRTIFGRVKNVVVSFSINVDV